MNYFKTSKFIIHYIIETKIGIIIKDEIYSIHVNDIDLLLCKIIWECIYV